MERYIGCIPVEDASGCRFKVYEYRHGWAFTKSSRYMLETGEAATRLPDGTFVIARTGETLMPMLGE